MTYIHTSSPTRAKLSTHMRSQHKGSKPDELTGAPLVEALTKHNVSFDIAALGELMGSQTALQAIADFFKAAINKAADLGAEAKFELETMVEGLKRGKSGAETGARLRPGNVYIEDIHAFKAELIPSKAAVPLEPLKSLAKL